MKGIKSLIIMMALMVATPFTVKADELIIGGICYELSDNGTARVLEYSYEGDLVIPSQFMYNEKTYIVTEIDYNAFCDNDAITSIQVDAKIPEISEIFRGCINLKQAIFADGTESFNGTFRGCESLLHVKLPSTTKRIGIDTFNKCSSLQSLTIPGSVEEITEALNGCENLDTLIIEKSDNVLSMSANMNFPLKILYMGRTTYSSYDWTSGFPQTLEEVIISGNTIIPDYAFCNLQALNKVSIEEGVVEIGNYAFQDCASLKSVILPSSLKKIGENVFDRCKGLKNASIKSGIIELPSYMFYECDSLSEVSLSAGLKTIGMNCFGECVSLSKIDIPESVDSIGMGAFSGCILLNNIKLPEGVKRISSYVFSGCEGLTTITLPDAVDIIESGAFSECRSLQEIHIGDNVKCVEDGAFQSCVNLANVYYNGDIEDWMSINMNAESYQEDTNPLSYAESFYIKNATGEEQLVTELIVPENITNIKPYAFAGYKGLISLIIPETVDSVGRSAFSQCINLETLVLRAHYVGEEAFLTDVKLKQVTLGGRLHTIKTNGFRLGLSSNGSNIEKTIYEGSLADWCGIMFDKDGANPFASKPLYIEGKKLEGDLILPCNFANDYTFYCNNTLTSVTVPYENTYIGDYAFYNCPLLKSITLGTNENMSVMSADEQEGISIGNMAFAYCSELSDINIVMGQLTNLGERSFEETKWYNEQPDGLVYIGTTAYAYKGTMPENSHITIEEGTTMLASSIFSSCSSLTSIELPSTLRRIGTAAFAYCNGLTNISLPKGIKEIGENAFSNCEYLTHVDLPESLTKVSDKLFYKCSSLESVTIPAGVTSMGSQVFSYCESLNELTSYATVPPTCKLLLIPSSDIYYTDTFSSAPTSTCKLIVPKGCANAYRTAEGWKTFTTIEETEVDAVSNIMIDVNDNGSHYDLSGKVVSPSTKGIHIIHKPNGTTHKIIVK